MTATISSRNDLEQMRGTPAFEAALLAIYGSMTTWSLEGGQWVAVEDTATIERLGFTKTTFLAEIAPFGFPSASPPNGQPPSLAELKAAKLSELSAKRFAVETGGTTFNAMQINTDRETCAIITAAYVKAIGDPNFTVSNWKLADGVFVTLDAPTIIAVADAMSAHVQAAFDREAVLTAEVMALATAEEVNAFDVNAEW